MSQLSQAREKLEALSRTLRAISGELDRIEPERAQYRLLRSVCSALDELSEMGAAELFWGDRAAADSSPEHVRRVRERLEAFNLRVAEIESRRQAIIDEIQRETSEAEWLEGDLYEVQEEEEERNQEWIVEREISPGPGTLVLPWNRSGEDDRRFRKSLTLAFLITTVFVLVATWIELPVLPAPDVAPDVPERVVRLLEQRRPPPPPQAVREEPKPKPEEQLAKREPERRKPVVPQAETPETPVEKAPEAPKGLLAFREKLAAAQQDQVVARLGSRANVNNAGGAPGQPRRAMLTTSAPGSSGGINLAALSRGVGGNGGSGMAGVQVARATSAIGGIGASGAARPLSGNGVGNSRTDEEIQIVFDRYKSALYRLYNRELRKDPTLRGQMVLRLTIEPDGSVSLCELHASDMNAAELSAQVVDRVRAINFGAKEGISAITILYPIDFLPAA